MLLIVSSLLAHHLTVNSLTVNSLDCEFPYFVVFVSTPGLKLFPSRPLRIKKKKKFPPPPVADMY